MKLNPTILAALAMAAASGTASAALSVINDPYTTGTADWLATARLRNFNSTVSDYEMMVNASPTLTPSSNPAIQASGQLPTGGTRADWAQNNQFWITYNPSANSGVGLVSLRLKGTGAQLNGATGGYDITISHAPDAVASAVNYIAFSLTDRVNFPTFNNGLTLTDLDGSNLGNFALATLGSDSWAIIDPGGLVLNNGFILEGSFTLDLAKVSEGREGDKVVFDIGHHSMVPVPEPSTYVAGALLSLPLVAGGIRKLRQRRSQVV